MSRRGKIIAWAVVAVLALLTVAAVFFVPIPIQPETAGKGGEPLIRGWCWEGDCFGEDNDGPPPGGSLDTTITSGPSEGSLIRSDSATFNFTQSGGDGTFECRLDEGTDGNTHYGAWESCSSGKTYSDASSNDLESRPHIFEVRAKNGAEVDPTPAKRQFTSWDCGTGQGDPNADDANTINITPGENIENIIESDSNTSHKEFCVHAGAYEIVGTSVSPYLHVKGADSLEGQPGTMRNDFVFPDGWHMAHAMDAIVEITDADTASLPDTEAEFATDARQGSVEIIRIDKVSATGAAAGVSWVECYGAEAITDANGDDLNGTGLCIKAGQGNENSPPIMWNELHHNGAKGVGQPKGDAFRNNHCYQNTYNASFKGWDGSCIKGGDEFEARDNYVHEEQGNGIWCDVNIQNRTALGTKGCWFHHNITVGGGRYGMRYEHTPTVTATRPRGYHYCEGNTATTLCNPVQEPNTVMERNVVAGNSTESNGFGGIACHDSQNCMIRYNWIQPYEIYGVQYGLNGSFTGQTPTSYPKAIQMTDSGVRTEAWNNDAINNYITGQQRIQGATSFLPEKVYATDNDSLQSVTGDEGPDTFQENNNYGYSPAIED